MELSVNSLVNINSLFHFSFSFCTEVFTEGSTGPMEMYYTCYYSTFLELWKW